MERKVQISTDGIKAKIIINGEDVSNLVSGYEIVHNAGDIPKIRILVKALEIDFETEMMPVLPEPWNHWYEPKGLSGNSEEALQD